MKMKSFRKLWVRLRHLLVDDSTTHIEVFMAFSLGAWACILLFGSPNILDVYASYATLQHVQTQFVWGCIFGVVAVLKLWSAVADNLYMRALSCMLATGLWSFVDASFILAQGSPTGQAVYALFTLSTFLIFLRTVRAIRDERDLNRRRANEHH